MQAIIARAWAETKRTITTWRFRVATVIFDAAAIGVGAFVSSNFDVHPWQAAVIAIGSGIGLGTASSGVMVFVVFLALARGGLMQDEMDRLAARVLELENVSTPGARSQRPPDPKADPVVHNGVRFVQRGVWADRERTPVAVAVCGEHNDAGLLYKELGRNPDKPRDEARIDEAAGTTLPAELEGWHAYWCPHGHAVRFRTTETHGAARIQVESIMLADVIAKRRASSDALNN